jgi:hypothetical protein
MERDFSLQVSDLLPFALREKGLGDEGNTREMREFIFDVK